MLACPFLPPLDPARGRLTSRYGVRPGRTSGAPTFHAGLDMIAEHARGEPRPHVYSTSDGLVQVIGREDRTRPGLRGYGNCLAVRVKESWEGERPLWVFYAHLSELADGLEEGSIVKPGAALGRIGNTSNGKFPGMAVHLHLELRHAGPGERVPIPGPYRRWNLDPEPWMAQHGLTFGRRGVFIWRGPCDLSTWSPGVA